MNAYPLTTYIWSKTQKSNTKRTPQATPDKTNISFRSRNESCLFYSGRKKQGGMPAKEIAQVHRRWQAARDSWEERGSVAARQGAPPPWWRHTAEHVTRVRVSTGNDDEWRLMTSRDYDFDGVYIQAAGARSDLPAVNPVSYCIQSLLLKSIQLPNTLLQKL